MSKVRLSASVASRSTLVIAASILAIVGLRVVLNRVFDSRWNADWTLAFKLTAIFSVGWFFVQFVYTYLALRSRDPVDEILMQVPSHSDEQTAAVSGFVAMEYFDLILNRTFLVFITPEGLYGWKAHGPVGAALPTYFEPYAAMLKDTDLMRDRETVRRLSELKGGFFVPRSEITSADVIYERKWGMGGVPHSGRIKIRTTTGKSREFILLGSVDAESIQQHILQG